MNPSIPSDLDTFFDSNAARIQAELFEFLRIPSVSTRAEHRPDMERAAEWLARSNEWLSVENFEKGMRTAAVLWEEMGAA